jgi:preprotein translocase SecE subunit
VKFVRESWAELRKVQWPSGKSVGQGTIVVAVVTVFFAVYLSVIDAGMVWIVDRLDKWLAG